MAFSHHKIGTIDASQCGTSDSTNFPVGIFITDPDLRLVANGGYVENANGYDIRVFSDGSLASAYDYQLVDYDGSTGRIELYFRLPTLSHTTNVTFALAFGDPGISTDGSSSSVWDANFWAVYHFGGSNSAQTADSKGGSGSLVGFNWTASTSQLGASVHFNGTNARARQSTSSAPATTEPITVESLVYFVSGGVAWSILSHTSGWNGWYNAGLGQYIAVANTFASYGLVLTPTATTSTWQNQAAVFTSTASRTAYLNGIAGTPETTSVTFGASPDNLALGGAAHDSLVDNFANVDLDEFRVSTVARSADWLKATANNQASASTFISWSSLLPATEASIAAVESTDAAAVAATNWRTAQVIATDSSDTVAITAPVTTVAQIAAAESTDAALLTAVNTTTAQVAATDSGDAVSVIATNWTAAQLAATETSDTTTVVLVVATVAAIVVSEESDTAAITGAGNAAVTSAGIAVVESSDIAAIAVGVTAGAEIATNESADSASVTAANWCTAQIAVVEAFDLTSITAENWTSGQIVVSDNADLCSLVASVGATVSASLNAADASDTDSISARASTGAAGAADVWAFVLSDGRTAEEVLIDTNTMMRELWMLHGLDIANPLTVTKTARTAGAIAQTLSGDATVTVTRH